MPENNENQNQKEIIEDRNKIPKPWKVFITEAFLFSLVLILGIATALKVNISLQSQKVSTPKISVLDFVFSFFLVTLFIYLVFYSKKLRKGKSVIFKTLFILAVLWGGGMCLSLWMPETLAIVLMAFLVFVWLRKPLVFIHDLIIILGLAGTGGLLGLSFEPKIVILLLIVFSVYDYVSVYVTKHMVKMAREMIENKTILGLVIPIEFSYFSEDLKGVKPGGKFLILGGGDVVFPLLLSVSLISGGALKPLIVALFSLFGLLLSFWLFFSQKNREAIPALPPIALLSIIGYLLTLIF